MKNRRVILIIFIQHIFFNNIFIASNKSNYGKSNNIDRSNNNDMEELNSQIDNIVNMNPDFVDNNSDFNNNTEVELSNKKETVETIDINSEKSKEESFSIIYIYEFLDEETTNITVILSLLKEMENTSAYFLMINDLINTELYISDKKIVLINGGSISFENEIIYENQDKRKFRFLISNSQYKLLIKLLNFFKNKSTNIKKYETLLNFFQNFNIKKYISKENLLLPNVINTNNSSDVVFTSPLNISKTIPSPYVRGSRKSKNNNKSKGSRGKGTKKTLGVKKSIEVNKKKSSIKAATLPKRKLTVRRNNRKRR